MNCAFLPLRDISLRVALSVAGCCGGDGGNCAQLIGLLLAGAGLFGANGSCLDDPLASEIRLDCSVISS